MEKDLTLNVNSKGAITEQESNDTPVSKTCSKCGETYTVNTEEELAEHFYYLDKEQGTLRKQCKECHRKRSRKDENSKRRSTVGKKTPRNKSGIRFENGIYVKTCGKCKHTYESDTENGLSKYFPYRNKKENILENRCKECRKIDNQKYVQNPENKLKKLENYKKWTAKNQDKVKGYSELRAELLDTYKALSDLTVLSTEELEFFKEKVQNKLNEINQELNNRNKESL